jgi:hypothetical protein
MPAQVILMTESAQVDDSAKGRRGGGVAEVLGGSAIPIAEIEGGAVHRVHEIESSIATFE